MRINGMFTLPEARGQGIAKALLEKCLAYGSEEARNVGMAFAASIVVDDDNPPARALYSKCGFVAISQKPLFIESHRIVVLMKYTPDSVR